MSELVRLIAGPALDPLALMQLLGDRPAVRANMVTSLDGHATIGGRVGDLTGPADQAMLTALRGWSDVVLVGAGTIRAEGYGVLELPREIRDARLAVDRAPHPVLAVVSGALDLDPALPAFADASPGDRPWVLTCPGADPARRAALAPYARLVEVPAGPDGHPAPTNVVEALRARGASRILSEGGPTVLHAEIGAGVVDELFVTLSPIAVGGHGPGIVAGDTYDPPVRARLQELWQGGDWVFARYDVAGSSSGADFA